MAVLIDTRTGFFPQADGSGDTPLRQSKLGALVTGDGQGRYFEQASRGNTFFAATQAGQTTTVALATTYVGLCLSNPVGNSYLIVPTKVSWAQTVIAAAVDNVGLGLGYNAVTNITHTTPVTPRSALFGTGRPPTALTDTSATLPTAPVWYCSLQDTPTATTNPAGGLVDLEGCVILPPGAYITFQTITASAAAAFWGSFSWEEIPILS